MPFPIQDHEYGQDFEVRRVRQDGVIKWSGQRIFVGEALAGELIGLECVEEHWQVHLGPMRLGQLHERSRTVVPLPPDEES